MVVLERGPVAGGAAGSFDVGRRARRPRQPPAPSHDRPGDPRSAPGAPRRRPAAAPRARPHPPRRTLDRVPAPPRRPRLPPAAGFALGAARDAAPLAPVRRRARGHVRRGPAREARPDDRASASTSPTRGSSGGSSPRSSTGSRRAGASSADSPLKLAARALRGGRGARASSGTRAAATASMSSARRTRPGPRAPRCGSRLPRCRLEATADGVAVELESGGAGRGGRAASRRSRCRCSRGCAGAPDDVLAAAGELRLRSMVLVYLVLERDRYTDVRRALPARAGDARDARLRAEELPRRPGPAGADRAVRGAPLQPRRRALVGGRRRARRDRGCGRSSTPASRTPEPSDVVVRRLPHAYPIYRVGWARPFAALDAWASRCSRGCSPSAARGCSRTTTRTTRWRWRGPRWTRSGRTAGSTTRAWAAARERFARHVVED